MQQHEDDPTIPFARILEMRSSDRQKRKGERTRDRLKAAAARLLEERRYRDLRVSDINEAAGVSNALFYIYFTNKEDITREILTEFLDRLSVLAHAGKARDGIEHTIYIANLLYTQRFEANPGLMYCLLQFGDEVPEFGRLWRKFSNDWADRVVGALSRHERTAFGTSQELAIATTALGMMVDGFLRVLYLDRDARLVDAVATLGPGPEGVARFLTRLWFRALFVTDLS